MPPFFALPFFDFLPSLLLNYLPNILTTLLHPQFGVVWELPEYVFHLVTGSISEGVVQCWHQYQPLRNTPNYPPKFHVSLHKDLPQIFPGGLRRGRPVFCSLDFWLSFLKVDIMFYIYCCLFLYFKVT